MDNSELIDTRHHYQAPLFQDADYCRLQTGRFAEEEEMRRCDRQLAGDDDWPQFDLRRWIY